METPEKNGGPVPCLQAEGTGSAGYVSLPDLKRSAGSPFVKCGKIELLHEDLLISYDSFGELHQVLILNQYLKCLARDRFAPPTPVMEDRSHDGRLREFVKIGYAARSASGKALKISTTTSGGDLIIPWTGFLRVIDRMTKSVPLSRLKIQQVQVRPVAGNIREGLMTGF